MAVQFDLRAKSEEVRKTKEKKRNENANNTLPRVSDVAEDKINGCEHRTKEGDLSLKHFERKFTTYCCYYY